MKTPEKGFDKVLDHDYDGIREYDNPLPAWWLYLFYGTIAFSIAYIAYYHIGPGPNQAQEYAAEMAVATQLAEAREAAKPKVEQPADALAAAEKDPVKLAAGKETYVKLCAACHRPDGGGLVGPNLTDDHWIHGGSMEAIVNVVTEGVPAKGMIAWKTQLSPAQIVEVSAYVRSLVGTNPPNPKAPEGEPSAVVN